MIQDRKPVNQIVIYTEARRIVKFICDNPLQTYQEYRNQTFLGGLADKWPRIPIVNLFLGLYSEKKQIFSQQEFIDYSLLRLQDDGWKELDNPDFKAAFAARLGRNFYLSFIKQLHVSSFCIELGWFHQIYWDAITDSASKHDLIGIRDGQPPIAIDLIMGTQRAREAYEYKRKRRKSVGSSVSKEYLVELPMRRSTPGGNAIWYCPRDFEHIVSEYCYDNTLWGHPAIPCYWHCHQKRI